MRRFAVPEPSTRRRVQAAVNAVATARPKPEQSCDYRLDLARGPEKVVVKQYTNGTLFLQGTGSLLDDVVAAVEGVTVEAPHFSGLVVPVVLAIVMAYLLDPMKVHVDLGTPERAHTARRDLFDDYGIFVSRQDGPTLLFTVHIGVTPEQVDLLAEAIGSLYGEPTSPTGCTGSRYVIAYPPGIPLQVPGEQLAAPPQLRGGEELYSTF